MEVFQKTFGGVPWSSRGGQTWMWNLTRLLDPKRSAT